MYIVDYEELVKFPYTDDEYEYPETMGFEFTSNTFKAFSNGIMNDEAGAHTVENTIHVSSTIREYNDFTWELSGNILTLTVTITDEWDGGSGNMEVYTITYVYTCKKVSKFSWE